MKYLDGRRLRRAVKAGWLWLNHNRERLNAINVFPVADGDTGTNMALTLKAAVSGANAARTDSLQDVADAIAVHSLRGARGNSGVILSQYFKGIAEHIRRRKRLGLQEMPGIFTAGAESAYRALQEPKEGTILTVLREIAEHLQDTKSRFRNLRHLLESAMNRGRESLARTKTKLRVLAEADVVDAGGQGFIHFVEGIHNFMRTGELAPEEKSSDTDGVVPEVVEEHSRFRYCAEFLIRGSQFETEEIKKSFDHFGDSLIVASSGPGSAELLRIHIHTDRPQSVRERASGLGEVEEAKIDDMQAQNRAMRNRIFRLRRKPALAVRIVTDSTCDLPEETARFHDIEVVPLTVTFGSRTYRDGLDLDRDLFYRLLSASREMPRTSQPSPGEMADVYGRVLKRGDCDRIISIHLSSRLSGTLNSAMAAGESFGSRLSYFDSGTVSLGLGLMAIAAAEMAREEIPPETITEKLETMRKNQTLFFTLRSIEFLIKGGRVGKARGFLGRLLGLKPLLSLSEGEVIPVARGRKESALLERIFSMLPEDPSGGRWAVGHAHCPETAEKIVSALKQRYTAKKVLTGEIGPTVGAHAGPGSWGVFYMKG